MCSSLFYGSNGKKRVGNGVMECKWKKKVVFSVIYSEKKTQIKSREKEKKMILGREKKKKMIMGGTHIAL
jgi:hypothetical protein